MDIGVGYILFLGFPIHLFYLQRPAKLYRNILSVWAGRKSWVGYSREPQKGLPPIRPGVIGTNGLPVRQLPEMEEGLVKLDQFYARDYHLNRDINLIIKGYKWLGT